MSKKCERTKSMLQDRTFGAAASGARHHTWLTVNDSFTMSQLYRAALLSLAFGSVSATIGFCNDKDLSCASWAKHGECEGENSETARPA